MKKILLLLSCASFLYSCDKDTQGIDRPINSLDIEKNDEYFYFEDGLSFDEVSSVFGKSSVQLNHHFEFNGEGFTGIVANTEGIGSQEELNIFIEEGMSSFIKDVGGEFFPNSTAPSAKKLNNNFLITGVLVNGISDIDMQALKSKLVSDSLSFSNKPPVQQVRSAKSLVEPISIRVKFEKLDLPNKGWIPDESVYQCDQATSRPNARFITQLMKWDNPNFASIIRNSTYEQDFILNDSNDSSLGPGTYLSDEEQFFKRPKPLYATTNFPAGYLDTRFQDNDFAKTYTIGCADAELLVADKWYVTFMLFGEGDADQDNASITAQVGEGRPISLPSNQANSTYFIFGVDTQVIYPSWTIDIPGQGAWKK